MKIVKWLGMCLFAVVASAGLESCSGEDEYTSRLRELIIKDLTFDANEDEGGVLTRTTTFRNEDLSNYQAIPDASWCHVTINVAQSQMTVTVDENNTFDQRKSIVTLTDIKKPEISRTFTVTQKQNNVIRVSQDFYEVDTKGGKFNIEFEHNVNDYEVSCNANWVVYKVNSATRGLSKKTISVSVAENDTEVDRKAALIIESESVDDPIIIKINQKYEKTPYFNMVKEYYEIDELGGNISVSAQTNKFSVKTGQIEFDIYEPQDSWAKLGEFELFKELFAVTQHVIVAPFTEKEYSRTTVMYMDEYEISITQYRQLYIKESSVSLLRNETQQLNIYNSDEFDVKWTSSDESVAKVDANGVVTGVGVGTATITVTSSNGKYKDSVLVTVEKPENLKDYLNVEWQPYFDGNEIESLACTLNNDSKYNIQLTRCEIYADLKLLSYMDYNERSGALAAGDSKKASFENLKGKGGDKFGFTVVWYYTFNGEQYVYRCEYTPY